MSANTTIQEGGKGYPFGPVKCLMVEGDDGKYYPWFPEADRQLDSLSVDKNGIYQASKYGVYGWSRANVNVPQTDSVTGRDPQTGQEVTVTADPETGELVETVVPVEIRVTTLPTKTDYTDGETIDYSGIVVHAYSSTGQDMGAVPFNELVFPIEKAIFDEEKYKEGSYYASSDLNIWPFDQPIGFTTGNIAKYKSSSGTVYTVLNVSASCKIVCFFYHRETTQWGEEHYPGYVLFASDNEFTGTKTNPSGRLNVQRWTHNGKTVYFTSESVGMYTRAGDTVDYEPRTNAELQEKAVFSSVESQRVAWTILHGDITYEPGGAKQTIPIYWQRPCDGAVLQAAFDIIVNQATGDD